MEDDESNIENIVKIINNKEVESSKKKNFKINYKNIRGTDTVYNVSFFHKNYTIHIPPSIVVYQGEETIIYRIHELTFLLNKFTKGDFFLKDKEEDVSFSIKNSINLLIQNFKYGGKYEIIENKSLKESPSFQEFLTTIHPEENFPQNCRYYKTYCKNINDFKYVSSKERDVFIDSIANFSFSEEKNLFITGQRGIGKTTTILYQFYQDEGPFLYINLKYFEESKNELEKNQILDFEKNNIFRPKYNKFLSNKSKKLINYNNEMFQYVQQINHIVYNDKKKDGINYISLLIQILSLVYKKLKDMEAKQNNELEIIKNDINVIIDKIKLLELPETILKKETYDLNFLSKKKNLFNIINVLLDYQAYLSYLLYCEELSTYNTSYIWDFIKRVLKKCEDLSLEFVLILDQYKNEYSEGEELNKIFTRFENSKILLCSSIDDYLIRKAILEKSHPNIIFKNNLLSLEDIKSIYKDIFDNITKGKEKYINLFKNNTREIFDCLFKKDEDINDYVKKKTDKIKNYFKKFCGNDLARFSYVIFIFKNIYCYWNEKDYKEIMEFIPFKYFTFEKVDKNSVIHNFTLGTLEECELSPNNEPLKEESKNNKVINYYHKISFSMPIVGNALYKFIRDDQNIIYFEHYLQTSKKGAGKGLTFEEYIKLKISNSKIKFIKNLKIDETVELWSCFSKTSYADIPNLFEGKLEKDKVYFIDIRNQREQFFDCAFIDLIKNKIIFTQITTSKNINHPVFDKEIIKKKSKESINFLKSNNFIDKNIELEAGYFLVFLKYDINTEEEILDESIKENLYYMKKINKELDKMKMKCNEKKLKYCIYQLSTIFSKEQKDNIYSQIEIDDENLYVLTKQDLNEKKNENEINEEELMTKRTYNEMILSNIELREINLENENAIKIFYEFYTDKCNLDKPKIYEEAKKLYSFDELEKYCNFLYCFGTPNNIKDNIYNFIYYDNSILRSLPIIQKALGEEKKLIEKPDKQQNYRLFFLGEKDEIESKICSIQGVNNNTFSKLEKNDIE